MNSPYELIGSEGCGSMIVEMAFRHVDLPVTLTDLPYLKQGPGRERLLSLNPLGQVPTLVLPDGSVLTESAAMMLHLADRAPAAGLLPAVGDRARPGALNLLIMLVAAVYPTFTFADKPESWVDESDSAAVLKQRIDNRRLDLWRQIDRQLAGSSEFAMGSAPTSIDFYLAAMVFWRPGREWFRREAPRLSAIADAAAGLPSVRPVLRRHGMG